MTGKSSLLISLALLLFVSVNLMAQTRNARVIAESARQKCCVR